MRAKTMKTISSTNQGGIVEEAMRKDRRLASLGRNAMAMVLGLCLSLAATASSGHSRHERMDRGVLKCGGTHFLRLGGTELHLVSYVFRNRSLKSSVTVERITFYDATGAVLFDSKISGFPQFVNGVLGPNDQTLKANQTGQLDVHGLLPYLAAWQRPMQLAVEWSDRDRSQALSVDLIRLVQQFDPATNVQGAEKTRDTQDCDEVGDMD